MIFNLLSAANSASGSDVKAGGCADAGSCNRRGMDDFQQTFSEEKTGRSAKHPQRHSSRQ